MTPPPLLTAYERHLRAARALSPATVRNYVVDVGPFVEYLEGQSLELGDKAEGLRRFVERNGASRAAREYRALVRDYVAWLGAEPRYGGKGIAPRSIARTLAALRTFVRWLIDEGKLPDAPLWAPRSGMLRRFAPKIPRRLPATVSVREAAELVEAPRARFEPRGDEGEGGERRLALALRDAAILELLYGAGLRVSEVIGLDVGDVAPAKRSVRVLGKGAKERQAPLGRPAAAAVKAYAQHGRGELAREGGGGGALFLNASGGRLSQRSVQSMVRSYAARAGLDKRIHPHVLRHTYATHLLDGGADLRIVQELLGHSTPVATQVYTHVSRGEARRVYMNAHPLARNSPSG